MPRRQGGKSRSYEGGCLIPVWIRKRRGYSSGIQSLRSVITESVDLVFVGHSVDFGVESWSSTDVRFIIILKKVLKDLRVLIAERNFTSLRLLYQNEKRND